MATAKIMILGILALAVILFIVVSPDQNNYPVSVNPAVQNQDTQDTVLTSQELFRLNCAGCHGTNREGNLPTFPSLVDIKDKLTKEEIRVQIKNGKGQMPPMAHLSEKEVTAITGYLYDEPGQVVNIASLTPVKRGEMLLRSNCTGCHRAVTTDPKPQNSATKMCAMMEPATLSGVPVWYTKDEFGKILDDGPCYMPSFSFLEQEDKDAIYDYLSTLEDSGTPKQPMMPMMGKRRGMMGKKMGRKN